MNAVEAEQRAYEVFRQFVAENAETLKPIAHHGDGRCGALLAILQEALCEPERPSTPAYRKRSINQNLRRQVMERDFYRCLRCSTHIDLCIDHIIPESKGGEAVAENLQTLCRSCNSKKGAQL